MTESKLTIADRIRTLRKEYQAQSPLVEEAVHADPYAQFAAWFDAAVKADLEEPNAMTLATCGKDGQPSARIVLLKDYSSSGFVFFTNYESKKGAQLEENQRAALLFFWAEFERQVRIEGDVSKTSRAQSEAYFSSRPRGAQLGAAVSRQSAIIAGRSELEARHAKFDREYEKVEIPCPAHWGGYILSPRYFEFWQGRENRLHDRISYRKEAAASWRLERLSP